LWKTSGRSKVAWWVECKSWDYSTAVTGEAIDNTADGEEGPSCWVPGTSGGGSCLEEVDLVDRVCLDSSREDDEELEKESTSHQNEGDETKDWACQN